MRTIFYCGVFEYLIIEKHLAFTDFKRYNKINWQFMKRNDIICYYTQKRREY